MALTSSSTLTDALAQYNDNLSWDGSAAKAALALEAIRWLLVNRPAANASGSVSVNYATLDAEKARLEAYVQSLGSSRASFVSGRAVMR